MANEFSIKIKAEGAKGGGIRRAPRGIAATGKRTASDIWKEGLAARTAFKDKSESIYAASKGDKNLIVSHNKLIASNKLLEKAVRMVASSFNRPAGGGAGGGRSFSFGGSGGGIGRIGTAMGVVGIPMAAAGFAISKINQIGNAYIDLVSQQKGTAALGGFQTRRGIYGSAEMGQATAEYAKGTGQFFRGNPFNNPGLYAAKNVASGYGINIAEAYGKAGIFSRAGGMGYGSAAAIGAGKGNVQADMQQFLSGIAGTLEESITNGFDASNMARDMSISLADLTKRMPGQSVAGAMQMARNFAGIKGAVGRGEYGSYEKMLTAKATQDMLVEQLSTAEGRAGLVSAGQLSSEQKARLDKVRGPMTIESIGKAIGPTAQNYLMQNIANTTDPLTLQARMMRGMVKMGGASTEGMQKAWQIYSHQGGVMGQGQFAIAYKQEMDRLKGGRKNTSDMIGIARETLSKDEFNIFNKQIQGQKLTKKEQSDYAKIENKVGEEIFKRQNPNEYAGVEGARIVQEQAKALETSRAGMGAERAGRREDLVMKYGQGFANLTITLEQTLAKMAASVDKIGVGEGGGAIAKTLGQINSAVSNPSGFIKNLSDSIGLTVGQTVGAPIVNLLKKIPGVSLTTNR